MSRPSSQNTGQPSNATNKAQHEAATNNGYSRTRPPSAEAHREHDFSSILRQQLRGEGRESRSSRSRSVRQRDEQERCAVCDWRQRNGDDDSDSPTILERRTLDTAQGLQDFLDNLSTEPEKPTEGGGAYTLQAVSLPEKVPTRKPLIILYGLNIAFLRTLLASPAVRLDPAFVDAHATRRKYRVTGGGSIVAGCWEYPELTAGLAKAPLLHRNDGKSAVEDGSHGADLRSLSHQEDAAAVFCRASLWAATRVDVLLLSRPVWIDCGGWLKRYRKKVIAWDTELSQRISERGHVTLIDGEETMSLDEELLHDSTVSASTGRCDLLGALEKLAQERWLDLFEVLRPRQRPVMFDGRSLEWYILQSLNRNADMSKALARNKAYSSEVYDWAELVQRLRDHISVLPTVSAPIPALWQKSPGKGVNKKAMAARTFLQAETATMIPIPRQRNDDSAPVSDSDENQRALDRVTYLGAVLLPVSIVSSILSMNETFEPGQRLFWVFWVATVPLTALSIIVIYADKLRTAVVWEEVGSQSESEAERKPTEPIPDEETAAKTNSKNDEKEAEKIHVGLPSPSPVRLSYRPSSSANGGIAAAPLAEAITHSGDDVVIDLSGAIYPQRHRVCLNGASVIPTTFNTGHGNEDDSGDVEHEEGSDEDEYESNNDASDDDDEEEDQLAQNTVNRLTYSRPPNGTRPHAWRKKQLGWGGAAMCILKMQKPLRVEDGGPPVAVVGVRRVSTEGPPARKRVRRRSSA